MIISVHIFAFADEGDRSMVRQVEVPENEIISNDIEDLLELVFRYGQNEFQPRRMPSVSVGDVAEINGKYYMVMGVGWQEINKEEFDGLQPPTSMYAMTRNFKDKNGEGKP